MYTPPDYKHYYFKFMCHPTDGLNFRLSISTLFVHLSKHKVRGNGYDLQGSSHRLRAMGFRLRKTKGFYF